MLDLTTSAAAPPAVAFSDALAPFLTLARQALPSLGLLTGAADDLERQLQVMLSFVCGPTLLAAFSRVRDRRYPIPQLRPPTAEAYDAFVTALREGGWRGVCDEWPGLAPLALGVVGDWLAATHELSRRLHDDIELLRAELGVEGAVTAVDVPLSDPHGGGRTVACLRFANGVRVIYKPRSVQMEAAWSALLETLPLQPFAPRVLPRGCYGWMQHVAAAPLPDESSAGLYYRRVGVLLCAAFFLDATDMHVDNLVAHGAHPVLVDLEGLLSARGDDLFPADADPALAAGNARLWRSVLRSRMLPRWRAHADGTFDLSALGTLDEQTVAQRVRAWRDVNTDRMDVTWVHAQARPMHNAPRLPGGPVAAPEAFEDDIVAGFELAWDPVRRAALDAFHGAVSRFLIRPTQLYRQVIEQSVAPACLRDLRGRDALLDSVSRSTARQAPLRPLVQMERDALARLDVPWFGVPVDGTTFVGTDAPAFHATALARAAADDDRDFQVALIRLSLATRRGRLGWSRSRLVQALLRHPIEADGHVTWVGLRLLGDSGKCDVGPLDASARLRLAGLLARVAATRRGADERSNAESLARRAALWALGDTALHMPLPALAETCRRPPLERLRADVLGFFVEMGRQGGLAHARVAGLDVYLGSTPAVAREVLVRRADVFSKGHGIGVQPAHTDTAAHVAWLHQLGTVIRRFDPPPIDPLRALTNPLNATVAMRELSLDVIGKAMFGDAFDRLRAAAGRYVERVVSSAPAPLGGLETPVAVPHDFLDVEREFTRQAEKLDAAPQTLVGRLRAMTGDSGERIDPQYAQELARVLLLGGFDTVATLLTWTIVLLARHPQPPEVDDMWILSEVLRLYPPAWCLSRFARADAEVCGREVKAGSLVLVSLWQLQRDPRWFSDPDSFDPMRWSPSRVAEIPREAYAPFGLGPRRCIGEAFAWTHARRILHALRARWGFRLRDERPIHPTVTLVLRPPEVLLVDLVETGAGE